MHHLQHISLITHTVCPLDLLRPSPAPHLKRFNSLLIILTQRPSLRSVRIRPHSITNSSPVLFSIPHIDIIGIFISYKKLLCSAGNSFVVGVFIFSYSYSVSY
uniref:Uncharacterized protein n=1 Tax=Cacopsylla melanoneura TaxID=428564 RepID=A0A8D9BLD6_9HEMI